MNRRTILLIFLLFACTLSQSKTIAPNQISNRKKPAVVVAIVVENMRPDYIQRYWGKFGQKGFRKIYSNGAVCTNTSLNLHTSAYASGTATIFSGVYPELHGIIDNTWYDREKKVVVNSAEDGNFLTVASDSKYGQASPLRMLAGTITDNLKIFTRGQAKIYSVALNRESAVFSAGHSAEGAWWLDPKTGRMISSTFYVKTTPDWVRIFNDTNYGEIYSFRTWSTLLPENEYNESVADDYIFEKGYDGLNTFPHSIGKIIKSSGNFEALKTVPYGNQIVKDFAIQLMRNENAGKDSITDFISVVFSSMDYMNNRFGPMSLEMEDTYLHLDKFISELIDSTETRFGKDKVLFFLTANTSASFPVDYLKEEFHLPVGYFNPENSFSLLNSYLGILYGNERWIEHSSDLQVWFDHELIKKHKIDMKEFCTAASNFINQFEGVLISIPGFEAELINHESGHISTIGKSYYRNRSGDILFLLKEGWQPTYKYKNVNYTDQAQVPLVFYGFNLDPVIITEKYNSIDIVPTLSLLIGIPTPDKCQGKVIKEVIK